MTHHVGPARGKVPQVILCCTPWASTQRPSIALGILAALCQKERVEARSFYLNMDIAATVGFENAGPLAAERSLYGFSEHLFAVDIFGKDVLASDDFLDAFTKAVRNDPTKREWASRFGQPEYAIHLRDEVVPKFLDAAVRRMLASEPDVVGFSATFNQVMSSLALARRLKLANPGVHTIFGGASFDGEMGLEYHRGLPEVITHIFLGEAEESFTEYLRRIKVGESTRGIPGVTSWIDGKLELVPGAPLADLNRSPLPNYDDFFGEAERLREETGKVFNIEMLPFESSRGCWWGHKNQCIFCGLNKELMSFRPKTVDRTIEDIATLSARYQKVKFAATDWILSHWHFEEFFRRLIELDFDWELFYEIRADMKKAHLKMMKQAGVVNVQPGIESLSTPVLRLMNKGTTSIRHVMFLRWCREIGIHLAYNILAGFPGEDPEWYAEMAKLLPRIVHLQPPKYNVHRIEMHRFAPLFEHTQNFGIDTLALRPDYGFNFPESTLDPMKTSYFFQFHSTDVPADGDYIQHIEEAIDKWIAAHKRQTPPMYEYWIGAGFLHIRDTRDGDGRFLRLAGLHHDVTLLCDQVQSRNALTETLAKFYPKEVSEGGLDIVIRELLDADVLMAEGNLLLTLPIGHRVRTTEELRAYVLDDNRLTGQLRQGAPSKLSGTMSSSDSLVVRLGTDENSEPASPSFGFDVHAAASNGLPISYTDS